jgi:hypothetical protein
MELCCMKYFFKKKKIYDRRVRLRSQKEIINNYHNSIFDPFILIIIIILFTEKDIKK